jgi:gluconolactonase
MRNSLLMSCCVMGSLLVLFGISANAQAEKKKAYPTFGKVHRFDPALDKILSKTAKLEKLAKGFEWSEGPVWIADGGYVLFSDIPHNWIVKWQEGKGKSVWLEPSGYTGKKKFTGSEPGCNGLMLDAKGRLVMCCHGDRAVKRFASIDPKAKLTVLASKYGGKRLNSPNDLVFHSNGDLYFTDPPYGLPKRYADPGRELDWCGVYRRDSKGELTLLTKEMTRPNGIAFSPDYKTLYLAQSDPKAAIWKAFPVKADGTLGKSRLVHDSTKYVGKIPGLPDGMCVDKAGNLFATGPGGVWIFSSAGKVLGRIDTGEATANCTFGDDGSTLYITADMYFCRIKTMSKGMGF